MNRFRTKKKAKEAKEAKEAHVAEESSLPSLSFMKSKKKPVEAKPELDLSAALPSTDDFRTSLLMPKLSARFSMLKEQDDPNSMLGKANDDSVLFPRRNSRLNLFGHNNQLGDIAEVSSLAGSARPSLTIGRGSYASGEGYATDDDPSPGTSIMSRPRPGEGNNLFGGRQKIYKIPMSSTPRNGSLSDSVGSGSGMGKVVYDDDVNLSAWQKLKQQEREQAEEKRALDTQRENRNILDALTPGQQTEDRKSTSTASTHSETRLSAQDPAAPGEGPAKSRTGGFSTERNPTKTRRLYGQGLELQNQHQQSSAINRIESLNRQRSATNDATQINRSVSRSALNLNEKFQTKPSPLFASSSFRPASPPVSAAPSPSGITDVTNRKPTLNGPDHALPLSPRVSEGDDLSPFAASIQPEDRGKATATGFFNKPATRYDDSQFTRRQIQMHEGRNPSPMRRPSPARTSSGAESTGRSRGLSTTSHQSKAESAMSTHSGSHDWSRRSDDRSRTGSIRKPSPPRPTNGTFLANLSGSESDDDENESSLNSRLATTSQNNEDIHPAFRTSVDLDPRTFKSANNTNLQPDSRDLNTIEENVTAETPTPAPGPGSGPAPVESEGPDSPTLGPSGLGLSGLIRTHLRQDSDKSSNFPPPSPGLYPTSLEINRDLCAPSISRSASHATSIHSNPFEYDDWTKNSSTSTPDKTTPAPTSAPAASSIPAPIPPPVSAPPPPPGPPNITSMSMRAKQMLNQAAALQQSTKSPAETENERPSEPVSSVTPWEDEARSGHRRTGSSETQMDREEFEHELAERRRKVQEKLKSITESGSRSSSPSSGHRAPNFSPAKSGNGFGALKSRSNTPVGRPDPSQAMHMRMLGMDSPASSSSPNLVSKNMWRDEEEKMRRDGSRHPPRSTSPYVGSQRSRSRPPHPLPRKSQEDIHGALPDDPYRRSGPRDRSGSDGSGRSKSRPRHREDLESVVEGPEIMNRGSGDEHRGGPSVPSSVPSSTRPSLEANDRANRFRSNSRPIIPSHLDTALHSSIQSGHPALIGNNAPRPSPVTPYSANTTPPLYETSPSASTAPSLHSLSSQKTQGLGGHKRVINKAIISEPKLVSTTNHVPTVGLPPGASLSNGLAPPIPPVNPRRRRQTTTQTILGAFKISDKTDTMPPSDAAGQSDELSTFSDEDNKPSRPRQRLRKTSSDGGNLNSKVRPTTGADSPAVPQVPSQMPMDGGMF